MGTLNARPRRRLDAVRRPQILAMAIELLREKGLWSVRIVDVAKRAGISPTSVVYYFGSKDQLFAAAIAGSDDAFYEALAPELAARSRAVDRLSCLIVRSSTSEWLLWMDLWVYALRHPEVDPAQHRFHLRWRRTIADVVRYGEQTGEWGPVDADQVAMRLAAVTDGLAVHMVLGDPDHSRESYVEMALTSAALELGLQADELIESANRCPPAEGPQ